MSLTHRFGLGIKSICKRFHFASGWRIGLAAVIVSVGTGCQTAPKPLPSWQQTLKEQLPILGHRNWIVIADAAYPDQTSPGVETIYTGGQQLDVVKVVLNELSHTKHVQPIIYLDSELEYVPEALAPGVQQYRSDFKLLLQGRPATTLPHEQIISKLDEAGRTFHVLIFKTDLTIPYTSVFLRLDCGYWGAESEQQLRDAISKGNH